MPRKSKTQHERQTNERRQLIFRTVVLDNRPLKLSKVREMFPDGGYTDVKAERDAASFRHVGCDIELRTGKALNGRQGEKEFVFLEGPHTDDDTTRESINVEGKQLVAQLAAAMICGLSEVKIENWLPKWMPSHLSEEWLAALSGAIASSPRTKLRADLEGILSSLKRHGSPHLSEYRSARAVLKLLQRSTLYLKERQTQLRTSLRSYWSEGTRLVALDSGTTNIWVARFLKEVRLPVPGSPFRSLTVCTNSRRIFEELGPSEVSVKTIIIGGQQKFRSPTIAGVMAEMFLRAVPFLQFGMCVLGSTRVDVDQLAVCSDSQEESSVKNLLMEKSSLRVICVDDSKLQSGPGREGYKFAAIDPRHIDLLITNSPFLESCDHKRYERFRSAVHAIEAAGVPVFVATLPQKTYPHPNEHDPVIDA
jgi:DeoR/GlpR family transcriptional regulator of sugar metabolism